MLSIGFGLVTASILALAGAGLSLQFSITNFVNFAYGDYATLGAYLVLLGIHWHLPFLGAAIASGIAMALLSLLLYRVTFRSFVRRRSQNVTMLIVSIGVSLAVQGVISAIWGSGFQTYQLTAQAPLSIGPFQLTTQQLAVIGVAVVGLLGLHILLRYTTIGKSMRAMSDDKDLAEVSGINTARITDITWLISGLLVGVAGIVLAVNTASFTPLLGNQFLFLIFAGVILGGIGKIYGAMLGALIIGVCTEVAAGFVGSAYADAAAFLLMILILLVRPSGLFTAKGRS
ncbi:MAG TPA: branched-chain amino acid ABC transporter permease [Pseudonocardiaceae bacterium]|jgi:branched-subunit amino acid ABC-type transport system permease component|nr:branched-chain amino acid ABC transporter permease [Pseudonocardiaceae bacterium]